MKIIENHFRRHFRARDRYGKLGAAGEDEAQDEGIQAAGDPPTDGLGDGPRMRSLAYESTSAPPLCGTRLDSCPTNGISRPPQPSIVSANARANRTASAHASLLSSSSDFGEALELRTVTSMIRVPPPTFLLTPADRGADMVLVERMQLYGDTFAHDPSPARH